MKRKATENTFIYDPNKKKQEYIQFDCSSPPSIAGLKMQHDIVKKVTQKSNLEDWQFRNNLHLYALIKQNKFEWARFMVEQRVSFYIMKAKYSDAFNNILNDYREDKEDYSEKISLNRFMPWYNKLNDNEKIDISSSLEPITDAINK